MATPSASADGAAAGLRSAMDGADGYLAREDSDEKTWLARVCGTGVRLGLERPSGGTIRGELNEE